MLKLTWQFAVTVLVLTAMTACSPRLKQHKLIEDIERSGYSLGAEVSLQSLGMKLREDPEYTRESAIWSSSQLKDIYFKAANGRIAIREDGILTAVQMREAPFPGCSDLDRITLESHRGTAIVNLDSGDILDVYGEPSWEDAPEYARGNSTWLYNFRYKKSSTALYRVFICLKPGESGSKDVQLVMVELSDDDDSAEK